MNEERLEYLINEMYYNYLEQNEAKELIDYIVDLQLENQKLKEENERLKQLVKQRIVVEELVI